MVNIVGIVCVCVCVCVYVCMCVYVCVCVCVFRVPVNEYNASYVCCDPPPPPPQLVHLHCCTLCTNYLQLSHFHVPNVLNLSNVMHKHALTSSTTPPSIYTTFTERNLPNLYPVHSAFFHTFAKIKMCNVGKITQMVYVLPEYSQISLYTTNTKPVLVSMTNLPPHICMITVRSFVVL